MQTETEVSLWHLLRLSPGFATAAGAKDWTVSLTPSLLPAGPRESLHFLLPPPFPVPTRGGTEARPTSTGYGLCAWTCQHSAAWAREKVLQHPQNMPCGLSTELLWLWKCPLWKLHSLECNPQPMSCWCSYPMTAAWEAGRQVREQRGSQERTLLREDSGEGSDRLHERVDLREWLSNPRWVAWVATLKQMGQPHDSQSTFKTESLEDLYLVFHSSKYETQSGPAWPGPVSCFGVCSVCSICGARWMEQGARGSQLPALPLAAGTPNLDAEFKWSLRFDKEFLHPRINIDLLTCKWWGIKILYLVLKPWYRQSFPGLLGSSAMYGPQVKLTRRLRCCNAKPQGAHWAPQLRPNTRQCAGQTGHLTGRLKDVSQAARKTNPGDTLSQRVWWWPGQHLFVLLIFRSPLLSLNLEFAYE